MSNGNGEVSPRGGESYPSFNLKDVNSLPELSQYVSNLTELVQNKFQSMTEQILSKINNMGVKIDDKNADPMVKEADEIGEN